MRILRIVLFAAVIVIAGCRGRTPALPVYQDAFLQPRVLAEVPADSLHHIADFTLTDQTGAPVSAADLRGRIHVAQFFFAQCTTMCPPMFKAMNQVRAAYPDADRVHLVSFTLVPEADSVAALQRFAASKHIAAPGWRLLTGDGAAIRTLAHDSYFVGVGGEGTATEHAGNLVLVDGALRVRGVYGVTHSSEVQRLIDDIATLEKEAR